MTTTYKWYTILTSCKVDFLATIETKRRSAHGEDQTWINTKKLSTKAKMTYEGNDIIIKGLGFNGGKTIKE